MNILLVEDDHLQHEPLMKNLSSSFRDINIKLIETESDFRISIPELESAPPDLILMDIMLRWTDPAPNMPDMPEDVERENFYTAGFRCQKILSENKKTMKIPIILYSVLDQADLEDKLKNLPKNVSFITKDIDVTQLFNEIRRVYNYYNTR